MRRTLAAILVSLASLPPEAPGGSGTASPVDPGRTVPPAVLEAVQGVVTLRVREVEKVPVFRGGRFEMEPVEGSGAGSGVLVTKDGLILTNAHVVAGSSEVRVRFASGEEAEGRVVSLDEASDLALVRAAGGPFRPLTFAEGGLPENGTAVFVVGDRGDAGPEVAWGTIGPHRRVRTGARPLEFWCEVDAPVGPGNSGGALLDSSGHLTGIPGLMIQYARDASGPTARAAGLFIPAAHAHRALQRLQEGAANVVWPWIGALLEDPLMAASEGRPYGDDQPARVRWIVPDSPAAAAGLKAGDQIVAIGARRPRDNFEALDAVLDLSPGVTVAVRVERGKERLDLEVSTGTRPADPRPAPLDDFTLHTGLRLKADRDPEEGRTVLAFAGLSPRARSEMLPIEVDLFAAGPILGALLPGQDALSGGSNRPTVVSPESLADLLPRCFVGEQFVAMAHWSLPGRKTVDRAYVHRKICPVVL